MNKFELDNLIKNIFPLTKAEREDAEKNRPFERQPSQLYLDDLERKSYRKLITELYLSIQAINNKLHSLLQKQDEPYGFHPIVVDEQKIVYPEEMNSCFKCDEKMNYICQINTNEEEPIFDGHTYARDIFSCDECGTIAIRNTWSKKGIMYVLPNMDIAVHHYE